jgi:hypothetical protein
MSLRLLIAAGELAAGPEQIPSGVRGLIDAADEILVVTPTLPTRFEWLASATRRADGKSAAYSIESMIGLGYR